MLTAERFRKLRWNEQGYLDDQQKSQFHQETLELCIQFCQQHQLYGGNSKKQLHVAEVSTNLYSQVLSEFARLADWSQLRLAEQFLSMLICALLDINDWCDSHWNDYDERRMEQYCLAVMGKDDQPGLPAALNQACQWARERADGQLLLESICRHLRSYRGKIECRPGGNITTIEQYEDIRVDTGGMQILLEAFYLLLSPLFRAEGREAFRAANLYFCESDDAIDVISDIQEKAANAFRFLPGDGLLGPYQALIQRVNGIYQQVAEWPDWFERECLLIMMDSFNRWNMACRRYDPTALRMVLSDLPDEEKEQQLQSMLSKPTGKTRHKQTEIRHRSNL